MKHIIITLMAIAISISAFADNRVKQDANGNYYVEKSETTKTADKPAGKTFTDAKGNTYDLYIGAKGGLYYWKTSKDGKPYKVYIKK